MREIMRNFTILVQSIAVVLAIACGVSLALGAQTERHTDVAAISPQRLLRQVAVYELKLDDLPNDMTVTIVKKGANRPEIHVEQGRMRYTAIEGNLGALPSKVRESVERMFGVPQPSAAGLR